MLQLQAKGGNEVSVVLDQARLNIGRDPGNDLVLDDSGVSGHHASIFFENGRTELVDLGSTNGTFLNGQKVAIRQELRPWDMVRFGSTELEVIDPSSRRPTMVQEAGPVAALATAVNAESALVAANALEVAPVTQKTVPPVANLKLVSPGTYPQALTINGAVTIGRNEKNSLALLSPTISLQHAEITVGGGKFTLVDLDSTNGSYVNGRRVTTQILQHGDLLRFDEIEYRIEVAAADDWTKTMVNSALWPGASGTIVNPAAASRLVPAKQKTLLEASARPSPGLAPTPEPPPASAAATSYPSTPPVSVPQPAPQPIPQPYPTANVENQHSGFQWFFFSVEGRINRLGYLAGSLAASGVYVLVVLAITILITGNLYVGETPDSYALGGQVLVAYFVLLAFQLWVGLSLAAKRLHDLNKSAQLLWVGLIPIVGQVALFIVGLVMLFGAGTPGPNRYGSAPE